MYAAEVTQGSLGFDAQKCKMPIMVPCVRGNIVLYNHFQLCFQQSTPGTPRRASRRKKTDQDSSGQGMYCIISLEVKVKVLTSVGGLKTCLDQSQDRLYMYPVLGLVLVLDSDVNESVFDSVSSLNPGRDRLETSKCGLKIYKKVKFFCDLYLVMLRK